MRRLRLVAVVIWSLATLAALLFPGGLDYGEGPLLDQAARLAAGQALYRWPIDHAPWTITNYPPLYPAMVAMLSRLTGGSLLVCGRALTAAATLLAALVLRSLAVRLWCREAAGDLALVLFLLDPAVLIWSGYVRVDLVALAFSLAALRLVLVDAASLRTLAATLACLVAAAATKQTYVLAVPLVCVFALARRSFSLAVSFAVAWALALLCLFALAQRLSGGGFAHHVILANANAWSGARALRLVGWGVVAGAPALVLARRLDRPVPPTLRVLVVAAAMTALLGGKVGAHTNYLLELGAALAAIAAGAVEPLRSTTVARLFAFAFLPSLALSAPELAHRLAGRATARALLRAVATSPVGGVLGDDMVSLAQAGLPIVYQPFEMRQLRAAEPAELLDALDHRAVALVVVEAADEPLARERWSPRFRATLARSYCRCRQLGDYVLFRPRTVNAEEGSPCAAACR